MKNYPLLPPLRKKDGAVGVLERPGTWESVNPSQLDNISKSLKVTAADANYSDVDSIPCMWARPLLFEMALYDIDHPMHKCIVGEWRGLLAMLALKERRNFPLKTKEIKIPDVNDKGAPKFLQALRRLLPKHTLEAETTWDTLYLILFNEQPIGMTSPTTLLCTSIDYSDYISDVSWFKAPFLVDPTSDPDLNKEERAAVAGWLTKTEIGIFPADNDRIKFIKERLNEQISNFTGKLLDGAPAIEPKVSDTGLGMTQKLFSGMNYPIARKEYFTEKLFVIKQQDAFLPRNTLLPKGSDNLKVDSNPVTPILPITQESLREFSVSDLNERITFEQTGTGIKVNLQLPSPGDGAKADFTISQEYVKKKDGDGKIFKSYEIVEIPHLPVLEIWPNFRARNWEAYYTYFRKAGQDTFYAYPFLSDGAPASQSFEDMKITKTSAFPEAMICKYKSEISSNYEEAGVLLIRAPDLLPTGTKTWNVGIDFGTSSTTVYKDDPSDASPVERVVFKERLLQITDSRDLRARVYEDFISPRDEKTPFFSLFHEHRNSGSESENKSMLEPLLDGRIDFAETYELAEDTFSNLKWSPNPKDRIRTQAFLEQICLQCAAEATHKGVKEIKWSFSYPLAFSKSDRTQFSNIWSTVTEECSKASGIQKASMPKEEDVISKPESIATAHFFADKFENFASGAVCIDIGGETSDVSIWQNKTLYWQTSLRFAGRSIFLDLLRHNPEFLKNFGVADKDIELLRQRAHKPDDFYSQADTWIGAWINSSKGDLQKIFGIHGGKIQGTPFVQLIALGISGLLYYVGLILNRLGANGGFEKKMPNVYIGGNGSRILHWLANGNFEQDRENKHLLQEIILDASGFPPDGLFDLEITPNPKHEAAAGLVKEKSDLRSTRDQFDVLAGEVFTEDGKEYKWTEPLTDELFKNHLRPGNKLVQIEKFIESFNARLGKVLGREINLDEKLEDTLIKRLDDNLLHFHRTDVAKRTIEPLFILVLKNLLKQETKRWK